MFAEIPKSTQRILKQFHKYIVIDAEEVLVYNLFGKTN